MTTELLQTIVNQKLGFEVPRGEQGRIFVIDEDNKIKYIFFRNFSRKLALAAKKYIDEEFEIDTAFGIPFDIGASRLEGRVVSKSLVRTDLVSILVPEENYGQVLTSLENFTTGFL